jgi:hypothetical protein
VIAVVVLVVLGVFVVWVAFELPSIGTTWLHRDTRSVAIACAVVIVSWVVILGAIAALLAKAAIGAWS